MGAIRLILTAIITIIIILFVLSYFSGSLGSSDIFSQLKKSFSSFSEDREQANLSFSLSAEQKPEINKLVQDLNISVVPLSTELRITHGTIQTTNRIKISEYRGPLNLSGDTLTLNGTFNHLETEGLSLELKEDKIEGSVSFANLTMNEIYFPELSLSDISGSLKARGTELALTGQDINIICIRGIFTYDEKLHIDGYVKEVSIPDSGITIS